MHYNNNEGYQKPVIKEDKQQVVTKKMVLDMYRDLIRIAEKLQEEYINRNKDKK